MELFKRTKRNRALIPSYNYSKSGFATKLLSYNDTKTGINVLNEQGFLKLNNNEEYEIFIRNIPDIKNNTETYKPSIFIYRKEFENKTESVVWLFYPNKTYSILGRWFEEPLYYAIVDNQNKTINGFKTFFRWEDVLIQKDVVLSDDYLFYLDNTILVQPFLPKYEFILYPAMFGNQIAPVIYHKFENEKLGEKLNIVLPKECKNPLAPDWDFEISRPRFLFSKDNEGSVLYKWDFENSQWVEISPDNGEYITYDELSEKGHTYNEYLQIPDEAFQEQDKWYVVNNSYILPFQIRNEYFEEISQGTSFFYSYYDEITWRIVAIEI